MAIAREDLQALSRIRLDDAALLLQHDRYASSYYLSGYAVELALKARIARNFREGIIPDKKLVKDVYDEGHNLNKLIQLADLTNDLKAQENANKYFSQAWSIVKDWRVDSRYERTTDIWKAKFMYDAVANQDHGVYAWITNLW